MHDVTELSRVLAAPEIGGFSVQSLIDRPDAEVRRALSRFLRTAARSDTLLLHFACHGCTDSDGHLYLAAPDTELADIMVTALAAADLSRLIDRSPSRRTILILDCCFSGAISRVMVHRGGGDVPVIESLGGQGEGRVVITACKAEEYAWEHPGDVFALRSNPFHSVFAAALIDGLRTGAADLDEDGEITVEELYHYVYRRVLDAGAVQTPSMWSFGHGTMLVAHRPLTSADTPATAGPGQSSRPEPACTPWDAGQLNWAHALTRAVDDIVRPMAGSFSERSAWRMLANNEWKLAGAAFGDAVQTDSESPSAWWGSAVCHAVRGRWIHAGAAFEHAAELLQDNLAPRAGALLLAATTYEAANSLRGFELLDDATDILPLVPELLAFKTVRYERSRHLSDALRLAPGMAVSFRTIGVDTSEALTQALQVEQDRLAIVSRARAQLASLREVVGFDPPSDHPGEGPGPALARVHVPAAVAETQLQQYQCLIHNQRAELDAELVIVNTQIRTVLGLSANARTATMITAMRDCTTTIVDALRRTDQPLPIRAVGIPPPSIDVHTK